MDTNCAQYIWLDEATFQESELYIAVSYCPNTCTEANRRWKQKKLAFSSHKNKQSPILKNKCWCFVYSFVMALGPLYLISAWHPHGQWAWAGIIYQETGSPIPISSQFSICPSWRMFFFSSHICQPYRVIYLENPRNKIKKKKTIKRRYLMI